MGLIIVAGQSGQHATVVYEAALLSGMEVEGFATVEAASSFTLLDCTYLGQLDDIAGRTIADGAQFVVACGSNELRASTTRRLREQGASFATVCHPAAIISPSAVVGAGAMLLAGAIIGPRASVGEGAIVNHAASIDHDCAIGDFANISPGARLGGSVRAGAGIFLGLNACVLPGVRLGDGAILGAGAVVTKDVEPHSTVVGAPAKPA
jgi:sugar O-acyltransferase (sialic acid O-acetyltransferase NeuD family)